MKSVAHLIPLTALILVVPFSVQAKDLINTGGACTSQGAWTSAALAQTKALAQTVEALSKDPDCGAITNALKSANLSDLVKAESLEQRAQTAGPVHRMSSLAGELSSVRTVLSENPQNKSLVGRLTPLLTKVAIDHSTNASSLAASLSSAELQSMRDRLKSTARVGQAALSEIFRVGPQAALCFQKSQNTGAGLDAISAIIRMMGAFSSSEGALSRDFANLVSDFNRFMREMKYAGILEKLQAERFYSDMSCLIETTQQTYCSAKDGLKVLEFQAQETQVVAALRQGITSGQVKKDSAIEGYFLLNREVPIVTEWLQKVQFGIEPRVTSDAAFKSATVDSVANLMKAIFAIQGSYNENMLVYSSLPTIEQKQQNVRELLENVVNSMARGSWSGSSDTQTLNFFKQAMSEQMMPFYLIGRSTVPDEVLGRNAANQPMPVRTYLLDLTLAHELKNPDVVMAMIFERLTSLSNLALVEGSKYYAKRMSVDHVNLIDESLTDSALTVYQSIRNIRSYIATLASRYANAREEDQKLVLSMVDTLGRIDRVIESFNVLFKMGQDYNIDLRQQGASRSFANLDKEKAEKLRAAYSAAVTAVYVEFNILLQRDSFMSQRVSTYVRYDLFQRIKTQQDMSPYLNYLLVSSGKNVLNRLREFIGIGADAEADLANAQRINRANLDQLEELFNNDMWTYINDLSKKSGQWHMTNERMNPFHDTRLSLSNLHTTVWDFVRPKINPWAQLPSQDDDGALSFLRAKACLHTLGFKDWRKYQTVCRGAVLKSRLTGNAPSELRVQFNYDDLAKEKATSLSQTLDFAIRGAEPEGMRYKNVCSVRDYFRNNQVFWMTLAFQGASGENANPAAAQQPARSAAPADEIPSPF